MKEVTNFIEWSQLNPSAIVVVTVFTPEFDSKIITGTVEEINEGLFRECAEEVDLDFNDVGDDETLDQFIRNFVYRQSRDRGHHYTFMVVGPSGCISTLFQVDTAIKD